MHARRRYTSLCAIKVGWTVLPHLPYSLDLASSGFHLFGPLKEGLRGQHFVDNNVVIDAVKNGLPQLKENLPARHTGPRSSLEKMH